MNERERGGEGGGGGGGGNLTIYSEYKDNYTVLVPVLCPLSTPCQIITPLVEISIWLPNPNPSTDS